jgi:hypothetical protein
MVSVKQLAAQLQPHLAQTSAPKPKNFSSDSPIADPFVGFDVSVHPHAPFVLARVREFVRRAVRGEPCGLVLWSQFYGCGKTHLARAAERALSAIPKPTTWGGTTVSAHFLKVSQFFTAITDCYAKDEPVQPYITMLAKYPALIMDDYEIDGFKNIEWTQRQFNMLLDRIYESTPLMLTTNLSPENLIAAIGGRNWDRLHQMTGDDGIVDMTAIPSYRTRKATKWN